MRPRGIYWLCFSFSLFLFACSGEGEVELETPYEFEVKMESLDSVLMHCVSFQHAITDYKKWAAGFELHDTVLEKYDLSVMAIFRFAEDTNRVMVVMGAGDLGKAYEYSKSEATLEQMKAIGAVETPEIHILNAVHKGKKSENAKCMLVQHEVEDYKKWKEGFLQFDANNSHKGVSPVCVFYFHEDPSKVSILFEVESFDLGMEVFTSNSTRAAMKRMGALSDPVITLLNAVQ